MAERDSNGRFLPGHKSNGGRKPKASTEDRERIIRIGRYALDQIEEMLSDPNVEATVKARLIIFAIEKAFGRPKQEVEAATGTIEKLTAIMDKLDAEAQDDAE